MTQPNNVTLLRLCFCHAGFLENEETTLPEQHQRPTTDLLPVCAAFICGLRALQSAQFMTQFVQHKSKTKSKVDKSIWDLLWVSVVF